MDTKARRIGDVIVPVDFSQDSRHAVARAVRLRYSPGATLTLLHVIPDDLPPDMKRVIEEDARDKLADLASHTADDARDLGQPELAIHRALAFGPAARRIVDRAHHARAEAIVLGRHGARSYKALLVGSTAERVVRSSDVPVLVVTGAPDGASYRKPIVAMDRDGDATSAARLAVRLVPPAVTRIPMIHAIGSLAGDMIPYQTTAWGALAPIDLRGRAAAAMDRWATELADTGAQFLPDLRDGDARQVILDAAAELGPDLLAVGSHGRGLLGRAFLGSVSETIVRHAACDVLVARPAS